MKIVKTGPMAFPVDIATVAMVTTQRRHPTASLPHNDKDHPASSIPSTSIRAGWSVLTMGGNLISQRMQSPYKALSYKYRLVAPGF
jgi:hypothetical protein